MQKKFWSFVAFALLAVCCGWFLAACSDDDSEIEYLFDREVSELSVLRECAADADSGAHCYQIRFHYPIDTERLSKIYLWVDSTVVGDTARAVDDDKLEKATDSFEFKATKSLYDTIDLTGYIQEFVKERDSLMIAVYCEYDDHDDPGSVQRVYLHFGDDIPPSLVAIYDSVWTTGALFEWSRPTDQTDYYSPNELSGPIVGYNIVIYSSDKDEDIRDLKVKLETADGIDSTGSEFYRRHARIRSNNDSVWVDSVAHGDNTKNYLRITIADGKGYDKENYDNNRYRLIVEGLRAESEYTFGISSWDSCGNSSGTEGTSSVTTNLLFITTDSIAPLMPTSIFTIEDTLFPGMARLDSNNRLRIFWSRSVDPLKQDHNIQVDSVLNFPANYGCPFKICYDTVASYLIESYDKSSESWVAYSYAGGSGRFSKLYQVSGDTMEVVAEEQSTNGVSAFVTDTIRWVAPGDTLILRIRSIDKSGYYSVALIDTIAVSPGALAQEVECPEGFIAVKASDTTDAFCMERYEHRNDSGEFMVNVLHSEAVEACSGISASGFTVGLCNERDWELVCLSGGVLSYGVIEEELTDASEYLFANCNVSTNDSASAASISTRSSRCMNPMGVFDLAGQYQEWVMGRSEDTAAVVKGGSYKAFGGLDRESLALCTNRSFPYYTRPAYTTDPVYLYREGTRVDTVFEVDTSRTLYKKLTAKDFKDSLQFFDVQDSSGNSVGMDYAPYAEYRKGGDEWLESLGGGMKYVPDHIEVVFLTGERVAYRKASAFYKSPAIGFRCCAYPE
ncbi:MAG: hypothetical protein MJY98_12095 [Fibrobacter sp.]|nr:hypothetical protein [Fibrobacter sp.]